MITVALIFFSNQYQLNKRLLQINNQALVIHNFLASSNLLRELKNGLDSKVIISKLELKNLSIIILDKKMKILF